jgi:hypothetical protein
MPPSATPVQDASATATQTDAAGTADATASTDAAGLLSGTFDLVVTASPSCPTTGLSPLPLEDRELRVEVVAVARADGGATLRLPPAPDPNNLDTLDLELGADWNGTLVGDSRVDRTARAGVIIGFADGTTRGPAPIHGVPSWFADGALAGITGTLGGLFGESTYFSSQGGSCVATDHTWSLTPLP